MKTIVLKINKKNPDAGKIKKAADILSKGGVIAFPTDTVYGLAAGAFNLKAQKKIYNLKGRNYRKPLVIMSDTPGSLKHIVEINPDAAKLMKDFFPGPLTVVLPTTHLGKIAMGGRKDAGVRVPQDNIVSMLIKTLGSPIATTSANISGKPSAKTGAEALKYFKDKVGLLLDCGQAKLGKESTVVDMQKFPYTIVRKGFIPDKKLIECLEKTKVKRSRK